MHTNRNKTARFSRTSQLLANLSIALGLVAVLAPEVQGGFAFSDDTIGYVTAKGGAAYDDNIYLTHSNRTSSGIFDIMPGVEVDFGKNSITNAVFTAGEDFVFYSKKSSENSKLAQVQFDGKYSDEKVALKLDGGFHQTAQNDRDTNLPGVIVHEDRTVVNPSGEYNLSQKTALGAGFSYERIHYKTAGFSDLETYTVPVNAYYEVAPKIQTSVGYRYRADRVAFGNNSKDHYFNVGARGEFTPKLHGTFSVGYDLRHQERGSNQSAVGFESDLSYLYTEKTTFHLLASNDFSNSATGTSQKVFGVVFGATTALTERLNLDGSVGYHNYKYFDLNRTDDYYELSVGPSYRLEEHLVVAVKYNYRRNASNVLPQDFKDNLIQLSATVRY